MKRWVGLAGGAVIGVVALSGAVAQTPLAAPASAPLRLQYIQFSEYLPGGALLPQPGDFDHEYARVLTHKLPAAVTRAQVESMKRSELLAIRADQVGIRFEDMARDTVFGLLDDAVSAIGSPLASRVLGQGLDSASNKLDVAAREREDAAAEQRSQARQSKGAARIALQSLRHAAVIKRVSIWGSWVRIDNVREHTAIVYKPDLHRYLLIDDAHKQYRVIQGAAPPPAAAEQAACDMQFSAAPLGSATIGGAPAHGYRTTTTMTLPELTMTRHGTIYFWDTPVPAAVLAIATGHQPCAPATPVGRALPPNRLVLYRSIGNGKPAMTSGVSGVSASEQAMLASLLAQSSARTSGASSVPRIEVVNMRGDLRTLTDADRALFGPPTGYRQVSAHKAGPG